MTFGTPPDRREDDIFYGDLLASTHGDKEQLRVLMDVDASSLTQQLDPNNRVRSYFHCGKLAQYAADMKDRAKGEVVFQKFVADREKWLGRAKVSGSGGRFPSRLAYEAIEIETNTPEDARGSRAERQARLNRLIDEIKAYRDDMPEDSRGEAGRAEGSGVEANPTSRPASLRPAV